MEIKWQTIPIKDTYAGMYDGPHATPKPSESGPIFLGIKNVGESGQLDLSDVRHISEKEYPNWIKRVEPRRGDIVFSYEATLNRYAIIPKGFRGCLGRRMALIRPDESKACGKYLYYYFFGHVWRKVISQNTLIGSTVDRIPIAKFPDFPITIPSLPTQRIIAAILSAYDDLIENNLRRIKILEEMAQNLYREWFVKFRFPGYKHVRFIDTPLGRIPEEWEVKGTMENKNWTFIHQSIGPYEGVRRYYATADIDGITIAGDGIEYAYSEKPSRAQKQPLLNSVWFARMQETYKVLAVAKPNAALTTNSMLSSGFAGFEAPDEDSFAFLFLTIKSSEFHSEKDRYCTGATQRSLTNDGLSRILTISPPKEIVRDFGRVAMNFVELILALQQRNRNLRRTRDLLLPKLISGEVDVSELDIAISEEDQRS
jgi:type I restriction enzyme S subunit